MNSFCIVWITLCFVFFITIINKHIILKVQFNCSYTPSLVYHFNSFYLFFDRISYFWIYLSENMLDLQIMCSISLYKMFCVVDFLWFTICLFSIGISINIEIKVYLPSHIVARLIKNSCQFKVVFFYSLLCDGYEIYVFDLFCVALILR